MYWIFFFGNSQYDVSLILFYYTQIIYNGGGSKNAEKDTAVQRTLWGWVDSNQKPKISYHMVTNATVT